MLNIIGNILQAVRRGISNSLTALLLTKGFSSDGTEAIDGTAKQQEGRVRQDVGIYTFNGTNQYIDCGTEVGDYTDNFTICGWLKDPLNNDRIIAKRSGPNQQFDFFIRQSGSITLSFFDGSVVRNGSGVFVSGWNFFALKISANQLTFYLNGVKDESGAVSLTSYPSVNTLIGAYAGPTNLLNGSLKNLQIYNTALSDADITKLYNFEKITTIPVDEFLAEETTGNIAINSGSSGNNGTIFNLAAGFHDTALHSEFPSNANQKGYTLGDNSTYYYNNNDTGLIPSGVVIPAINSTQAAAYLAGGARASLEFTGKMPLNFKVGGANALAGNGTDRRIQEIAGFTTTDVTIFFRFKRSTASSVEIIISSDPSLGLGDGRWYIGMTATGTIQFFVGGTGGGDITTSTEYDDDLWHYLFLVNDGGTYSLYIDDISTNVGTANISVSLLKSQLQLLSLYTNIGGNFFNGSISNVQVYERALTENERQTAINNKAASTPKLILPFSEGNGNSVLDVVSGTSYPITNPASGMWVTGDDTLPSWNLLKGHSRYDYYFDGVDDDITLNSTIVNGTGDLEWILDIITSNDELGHILGLNSAALLQLINFTSIALRNSTGSALGTYTVSLLPFTKYQLRLVRTGTSVELFINGVSQGTIITSSALRDVNRFFGSSSYLEGILISAEKVGVGKWTNANGFIDEIGSNNGTINGSPTPIYIPSDLSGNNPLTNEPALNPAINGHNGSEVYLTAPRDYYLYQAENKNYVFDGVDDGIVTNVVVSGYTNATLRCKVVTFDTTNFILFTDGLVSLDYLLASQTPSTESVTGNSGSPIITIDNVLFSGNRSQLEIALSDGNLHEIEITNINFSSWSSFMIAQRNAYYYNGLVFDIEIEGSSNGVINHRWKGYGEDAWVDEITGTVSTINGNPAGEQFLYDGSNVPRNNLYAAFNDRLWQQTGKGTITYNIDNILRTIKKLTIRK